MDGTDPPHVAIVGGGFGGLYAAKALQHAPVKVTLVDRRNFHLFQPLLYQVATGGLSAGDIAQPLRAVFADDAHISVLMGEAVDLDVWQRTLLLQEGRVPQRPLPVFHGRPHTEDADAVDLRRRLRLGGERRHEEAESEAHEERDEASHHHRALKKARQAH
jgi:NADH dehydrogenase